VKYDPHFTFYFLSNLMEVPPQEKNSPPQIENRDFAIFDDFYRKMALF
jgi:hypothetical protein